MESLCLKQSEREILSLMARGDSNREIAWRLSLPHTALNNRVQRLMKRMGARSRTEAVVIGLRTGQISLPDDE